MQKQYGRKLGYCGVSRRLLFQFWPAAKTRQGAVFGPLVSFIAERYGQVNAALPLVPQLLVTVTVWLPDPNAGGFDVIVVLVTMVKLSAGVLPSYVTAVTSNEAPVKSKFVPESV